MLLLHESAGRLRDSVQRTLLMLLLRVSMGRLRDRVQPRGPGTLLLLRQRDPDLSLLRVPATRLVDNRVGAPLIRMRTTLSRGADTARE